MSRVACSETYVKCVNATISVNYIEDLINYIEDLINYIEDLINYIEDLTRVVI